MRFDARTSSKLRAGQHLTFDGFPGLRFQASESRRFWIYRYKSPIDNRMRQVKLGEWPARGFPAAIFEWEQKQDESDSGEDPAAAKREKRTAVAISCAWTLIP
ncbi:alpha/beta hydrolase [Burkholderia lata]|uniref:Alpha/beta hydrolase n=1 Tax=Burkholderia lata (strain ATCC 17760 / DSM 23089 / LMG 22485 / NCIMB 9086 / R18194 / 383) TaxID=482957 RepID=A0A6P2TSV9_BURL3|nr:alpha/beta hydrolase [Burkholderia lata]